MTWLSQSQHWTVPRNEQKMQGTILCVPELTSRIPPRRPFIESLLDDSISDDDTPRCSVIAPAVTGGGSGTGALDEENVVLDDYPDDAGTYGEHDNDGSGSSQSTDVWNEPARAGQATAR